jgi:ElaB/YqjD/DUF883 family membrane-anchored ribosome-binding protein
VRFCDEQSNRNPISRRLRIEKEFEMAENRISEGINTPTSSTGTGSTGGTGGGIGGTGTGTGTGTGSTYGRSPSTGTSAGTGAATALSETAQGYGQKISEAATQAKDYVSDKVAVVGDKIKELQNADLGEIAENAKDYARKNPGQAILISAAAGLLLGLIIRGRR